MKMKVTATLTALCMSPIVYAQTAEQPPPQQQQMQPAPPPAPPYGYPAQPQQQQQYAYPPTYQAYPPPRYQLQPTFHTEERPLVGLAIAGGSVFGAVYTFTAIGGYAGNAWEFAVPVIGPLLWAGRHLDQGDGVARVATSFLALDTLAQGAGLAMLIAGLCVKHKVRVLDRPQVSFTPTTIGHAPALGLSGNF
jgi:hypothetical protein